MWAITQHGYVSAVAHRDLPKSLMVRARDRQSLEEVARRLRKDDSEIYTDFPSDYPYRIVVTKKEFKAYLAQEVNEIGYTNFKTRLTATRGHVWHSVAMSIWTATHRLTPAAVAAENDAARLPFMHAGIPAKAMTKKERKAARKAAKRGFDYQETNDDWDAFLHHQELETTRAALRDMPEFEDVEADDKLQMALDSLATKPIHDLTDEEWARVNFSM